MVVLRLLAAFHGRCLRCRYKKERRVGINQLKATSLNGLQTLTRPRWGEKTFGAFDRQVRATDHAKAGAPTLAGRATI